MVFKTYRGESQKLNRNKQECQRCVNGRYTMDVMKQAPKHLMPSSPIFHEKVLNEFNSAFTTRENLIPT